jgi:hypothetical protein
MTEKSKDSKQGKNKEVVEQSKKKEEEVKDTKK